MSALSTYFLSVLALAFLCAAWMGIQLLARKMQTKNHIDDGGGCCGACVNRDTCDLKEGHSDQSSNGIKPVQMN